MMEVVKADSLQISHEVAMCAITVFTLVYINGIVVVFARTFASSIYTHTS